MARKRRPKTFHKLIAQLQAAHEGQLVPPLEGYVYRFTIFLPLLSKRGDAVFKEEHVVLLYRLFLDCFGGFSEAAALGQPPWYGAWRPESTSEPEVDRHTMFVIYSPQSDDAVAFFGKLRWILQQPHVAEQQVVVIEQTAVQLVKSIAAQ